MISSSNQDQKLIATFIISGITFLTLIAERFQEIFASVGAALIVRNVTTVASDPGQRMILSLGVDFYQIITFGSFGTVRIFIIGMFLLVFYFIWAEEINAGLKKLQTMKITFNNKKEE
jgi:hypothetical protein